jgi:RimJ/RimL family protein N-acetyltransferase
LRWRWHHRISSDDESHDPPLTFPIELRTPRLLLRAWRPTDAAPLHRILTDNLAHLSPWIPARIADPATVPALAARLAEFGAQFEVDSPGAREWRYAMVRGEDGLLLGELSLFPRDASARVAYGQADRIEIGYWQRADAGGNGYVTEAVRAVLDVIRSDPRLPLVEIRCDERNTPSGAIPRRLGFDLWATDNGVQVWTLRVAA